MPATTFTIVINSKNVPNLAALIKSAESNLTEITLQTDFSELNDAELELFKIGLSVTPPTIRNINLSNTSPKPHTNLPGILASIPEHVGGIILNDNDLAALCQTNDEADKLLKQLGRFERVQLQNTELSQLPDSISFKWPENKKTTSLNLSSNNLAEMSERRLVSFLQSIGSIGNLWLAGNNFSTPEHAETLSSALIACDFKPKAHLVLGNNPLGNHGINSFTKLFDKFHPNIEKLELYAVELATLSFVELKAFFSSIPPTLKALSIRGNKINVKTLNGTRVTAESVLDGFQQAIAPISPAINTISLAGNTLLPINTQKAVKQYVNGLPKTITKGSFTQAEESYFSRKHEPLKSAESVLKGLPAISTHNLAGNSLPTNPTPSAGNKPIPSSTNALAQGTVFSIEQLGQVKSEASHSLSPLVALKERYKDVAREYIRYTTANCFWSIKSWHGETGRVTAGKIIQLIDAAKTIDDVEKIISKNLEGGFGGRKNPHSLRTMFLAARIFPDVPDIINVLKDKKTLREISNGFNDLKAKLDESDFQIIKR